MRVESDMVTAEAEVEEADGSWDWMKLVVSSIGAKKPAMREMGSKIVKTKRGMGGRMEDMVAVVE
jgi:hypothetical protein